MKLVDRAIIRALHLKPSDSARVDERVFAVSCGYANFFVCRKEDAVIAIDTGPSKAAALRGMAAAGLNPAEISRVFLTHTDFDHAGGLAAFPDAQVFFSEDEEPLVAGKRTVRLYGLGRNRRIKRAYTLLSDGQTVSVGPLSVTALKTPGHTIGSMSYIVDGTLLFTGDALCLHRGQAHPNPHFRMNDVALRQSARRLAALEGVSWLITAHSGWSPYRDATERLRAEPEQPGAGKNRS
ncbi:MAG: MBL fold metallo-hydrolase [Oscillospiraceae bacterium]|jgi:glyoxylase-like metal-dependent hydrolase (beta-lactamase superfamily II)|nr:MBL fold metallo-hydrolase [Oscillospiraceae bacterium]